VAFDWEVVELGGWKESDVPLLDPVLKSVARTRVALKGPITTPIGGGFRSVNVALRKKLDLYACVRPCKTYPGVPLARENIDLVVVRENTEDLYAGIEFAQRSEEMSKLADMVFEATGDQIGHDAAVSLKVISEHASERIVRFAFEYAKQNSRKKVTAVHKANILKFSDGLFQAVARRVASQYPEVEFSDMLIDAACMQLVRRPEQFDVLVLPNFYGDFVSDLAAGLVGGLGVAPGANIGDGIAVFEPTHGSTPKYAGQNRTNPMATMLSGVMMLRYLNEETSAAQLESAIASVILEGRKVTYDLKADPRDASAVGTNEVAEAVIEKLQ